jgi:hypothetical protein
VPSVKPVDEPENNQQADNNHSATSLLYSMKAISVCQPSPPDLRNDFTVNYKISLAETIGHKPETFSAQNA